MGRDYEHELAQLPKTYNWALELNLESLVHHVRSTASLPLVPVGSGGSYSAAEFAAFLHSEATGRITRAMTPLEIVASSLNWHHLAAMLLTASGRNPDILAALDMLLMREPRALAILTTRRGGPVLSRSGTSPRVSICQFPVPSGKDGYLATNSLLTSVLVLARAYAEAGLIDWTPPASLGALLGDNSTETIETTLAHLQAKTAPLWDRTSLVVLYSPATRAAAYDLESRFSEAGLIPVSVSDFRNFAHGRHFWLQRHGQSTAVLALVGSSAQQVASSLMKLIPPHIPTVSLEFKGGALSESLAAVVTSVLLAQCAGKSFDINPGRPTVPQFGRKMYHLSALRSATHLRFPGELTPSAASAIARKSSCPVEQLDRQGLLGAWVNSYHRFLRELAAARFSAVAIDYDGTLCDPTQRFTGPSEPAAAALLQVLKKKLPLVIATGRGKSVRAQLQACLPRRFWGRVLVGYYNGSDIALLTDDHRPNKGSPATAELRGLAECLQQNELLSTIADFDVRPYQISCSPKGGFLVDALWQLVESFVRKTSSGAIQALRSDHSVDIFPATVSKRNVLEEAISHFGLSTASQFLTIGDKGKWPGNDCEFLAQPCALSVDECSDDPTTCWNIAAPGTSHSRATVDYLEWLTFSNGLARFPLDKLEACE